MKKILLSVIVWSFILSNVIFSGCAAKKRRAIVASDIEKDIWAQYDTSPEFLGGGKATEWVDSRLRYPVLAQENGIEGRVYVQFVIKKNGSVTDVKIMRGVDASLDNEAIRVVKSMPKWKAGTYFNKVVRCSFSMPVNFKLPQAMKNK